MDHIYMNLQSYLKDNFDTYKNIVINEMILYYGEEYSDIIKNRLEDTNFIFYINPKYISLFKNIKMDKKTNYRELKKDYHHIQKELKKNDDNGEVYNSKNEYSYAYQSISRDNGICFTYMYASDSLKKDIFIPVFYADDSAIIHEMIHAVMSTPLFVDKKNDHNDLVFKTGLGVSNDRVSVLMEECMTEFDSKIIYKTLKEKNISFIDDFYLFTNADSFYDNFIPGIISFYQSFKTEIINARINLDVNNLVNYVGKDNYRKFLLTFKGFYEDIYDCDKSFYKVFLDGCVSSMKEYQMNKQK